MILQGHLDMVCEKDADCDIDFSKDGLRLRHDDTYIFADGTTLGGDDRHCRGLMRWRCWIPIR